MIIKDLSTLNILQVKKNQFEFFNQIKKSLL